VRSSSADSNRYLLRDLELSLVLLATDVQDGELVCLWNGSSIPDERPETGQGRLHEMIRR